MEINFAIFYRKNKISRYKKYTVPVVFRKNTF